MSCAGRGDAAGARLLLDFGAEPRRLDGNGGTALHYASAHGHLACVELLLAAGADPAEEAEVGLALDPADFPLPLPDADADRSRLADVRTRLQLRRVWLAGAEEAARVAAEEEAARLRAKAAASICYSSREDSRRMRTRVQTLIGLPPDSRKKLLNAHERSKKLLGPAILEIQNGEPEEAATTAPVKATARFDFVGKEDDGLSLTKGEVIVVTSQDGGMRATSSLPPPPPPPPRPPAPITRAYRGLPAYRLVGRRERRWEQTWGFPE
jgi:hypothetical protein